MKLAEFNRLAGAAGQYRCSVITIHGVLTRGEWQKWVATPLADAGIRSIAVDIGWQFVRAILWPERTADAVVPRVISAWQEHDARGHRPIHAIAHSFGTLVLARALMRNPAMRLKRAILCGCILRPDFPWPKLAKRHQVEEVLNEMSMEDRAVRSAHALLCRWTGRAGVDGFEESDGVTVRNVEYEWLCHSDTTTRIHAEKKWIPYLLTGSIE
jgi:pimeloyl-ACP methyl ester carboxylesterase